MSFVYKFPPTVATRISLDMWKEDENDNHPYRAPPKLQSKSTWIGSCDGLHTCPLAETVKIRNLAHKCDIPCFGTDRCVHCYGCGRYLYSEVDVDMPQFPEGVRELYKKLKVKLD